MDAVRHILHRSGGFPAIMANTPLMHLLQWVEIIGCYVLDLPPVFPYLTGNGDLSLEACDSPSLHVPIAWPVPMPATSKIASLFRTLLGVNEHVVSLAEHLGECISDHPVDIGQLINPILHGLLSAGHASSGAEPLCFVERCGRSGALLYLAEFRRQCGNSPVITVMHVERVRGLLLFQDFGESALPPSLRFWLVFLGAIEAVTRAHQSFFHATLSTLLDNRGFPSREAIEVELHKILWFDGLFEAKIESLIQSCSG